MALRCAPSSRWRRKFSASAQMSELEQEDKLFQMAAAETAKSLAPMTHGILIGTYTMPYSSV